jgi:hypothetical protein
MGNIIDIYYLNNEALVDPSNAQNGSKPTNSSYGIIDSSVVTDTTYPDSVYEDAIIEGEGTIETDKNAIDWGKYSDAVVGQATVYNDNGLNSYKYVEAVDGNKPNSPVYIPPTNVDSSFYTNNTFGATGNGGSVKMIDNSNQALHPYNDTSSYIDSSDGVHGYNHVDFSSEQIDIDSVSWQLSNNEMFPASPKLTAEDLKKKYPNLINMRELTTGPSTVKTTT